MARMRKTKRSNRQKASKKNVDRFAKNRATKAKERAARSPTGGESTGREKGIMASQKANKIKGLEQSVGSLDRRINTALEKGDTGLAKDLRSRQNKFTTKLGLERAIEGGGVMRDSSGRIVRSTRTGQPIMNTQGRTIFDQTKDMDFIDPTRRIQNVGGDAYGKMYPISNAMQRGLPALSNLVPGLGTIKNIAKSALSPFKDAGRDLRTMAGDVTGRPFKGLGEDLSNLFNRKKNKQIPYTDDMMPGERYPLDKGFGAYEDEEVIKEEDFYGGQSLLDEDSSLEDIIKRYTPPERETIKPKIKPKPDPDWPRELPEREFWKDEEIVDEFGFNTVQPKEVIVRDVLDNLAQKIAVEENIPIDDAHIRARNELSESTLTKPSFNMGEFTKKFRTNNAEKEARTILESLPPEIIQKIPPEIINESSAIDIVSSLPPEIIEKTKFDIQTKAVPNIYQKPGEKVITMADLAAEAGTGPTLKQALPVKKMATTMADMIPYLATGYSGNQWGDMIDTGMDKLTGWNTQTGSDYLQEQNAVKENTSNLLKEQYNLSDDQIQQLLNVNTGFTGNF